ncbi:MAG: SPFH domain-containing protein [Candidatus Magasanikbacteria bacterium]|nr:SPFH domain-containing protein [Candidatus Magasanikbacteria bacterium]
MNQALLAIFTPIIAAITGLFKIISSVGEGERGIVLRFGKARCDEKGNPRIFEPGIVWLLPFADTIHIRHIKQQTIHFKGQRIILKNQLSFYVSAVVIFRINEVYKALFEIENVDASIEDLCMGILRDVLSKRDHKTISETKKIADELLKEVKSRAEEWGVEFIQFNLTNCDPTPETANVIILETGTRIRLDALKKFTKESKEVLEGLNPNLAAVLIGAPLVATVSKSDEKNKS